MPVPKSIKDLQIEYDKIGDELDAGNKRLCDVREKLFNIDSYERKLIANITATQLSKTEAGADMVANMAALVKRLGFGTDLITSKKS